MTTVTDAKGNIISSTVYNSLNLPSSVTDAAGKSTEYTYNSLGKVATITDPLNQVKTFEYNSRGQNVKVTDPLNGVSTAAYNAFGKVTALTGPTGAATNYTYDNLGRLTAETTPAGGSIEYGYNELHLRNEITNGRDQTHTLQYDMSGRIYSRVTPEGTIRYTYDGCNNIIKVVGPNGTINRTFDKLNRVTSYTDALGKTVQYQYDAVGNLVKLIYPDNAAVTYAYDANHNLISVTDWEDRITTYTYDVNNKVTSIAKWDESVTSYTYDDAQRLISYTVCDYLNDVIVGYEYTYDHLGRIIMEKDLVKELQMSYTYDELSRVTKRALTDLTDPDYLEEETFAYDLAGNLTDDAGNATFTYGTNNRLTAYNNTAISYDLDGNMLNVGAMNCTYDSSNRLIAAGGLAYTYDAENTRIRSVNGTVETTYTYDVNARMSRLLMKTTGNDVKKYIYGLGLLYEDDGSDFLTYHFDLRGSTVAISDDSGMIVDTFEYDTYGKLLGHFGGTDTPFLYNGRDGVMTEANGLYYMRNRYYSPDLRRFINADVIAGELTNAVTMNRYAYANANPVMFVDPLGLAADSYAEYDRNAAIAYAKEWSGGKSYKKSFWEYLFSDRNREYYSYKNNCANFVSQCMYNGGISMNEDWHMYSTELDFWGKLSNPQGVSKAFRHEWYDWEVTATWSVVSDQYEYFSNPQNGYASGLVIRVTPEDDINSIIEFYDIQAGDLMYWADGEDASVDELKHATMISKVDDHEIYFTGNTRRRFDKELSDTLSGSTVYIVHMNDYIRE